MQLLIQNIDELKKAFHYVNDHRIIYEDELLNTYHNNCVFLNSFEEQITHQTKITTRDILYSLYYWQHQFLGRANEISHFDAGFEQWHFKTIDQIEYCCGEIDFSLLEKIENNEIQV